MGSDLVALFLNGIIAILLVATIFYVYRLTKTLDNFKEHRRELDSVIANLLSSIDQADRSVQTLKRTSAKEADDLEHLIGQAKALSDELKVINDAGESMAKRLENLAETNRKIVQPASSISGYVSSNKESKIRSPVYSGEAKRRKSKKTSSERKGKESYSSTLKRVDSNSEIGEEDFPSFMIHDHDIEKTDDAGLHEDSNDYETNDELESQAERDLLEALRSGRKNITEGDR